MNELGAILLVISGALVIFQVFTAFLGIHIKEGIRLSPLLSLVIFDIWSKKRKKLSRLWIRTLWSFLYPLQRYCRNFLNISNSNTAYKISRISFYANFIITSISLFTLILLMIWGDLSNKYVVSHTSLDLPLFFRITATWAGSSGSLLFWYWLLTLFCMIAAHQSKALNSKQIPVFFLILAITQLVFISLNLFYRDAQPFRVYPIIMQAGRGINPLLLHWAMIIHPPILYIGYVSSAIPFALLFSSLITGNITKKQKDNLFTISRTWIIISWFFLGTGILLGSKWAYEELGWGGYWAWDPVENASLMPWLIFTALIHSFIVQERRGALRFWNICLVFLAYHISLLGTWITRSGILEGPHTFAKSTIGTPMIISIGLSALFFIRFLYFSRHKLRPDRNIHALTSKEGSFLLNNFLMLLAMFILLIGIFSPLLPIDCGFQNNGFECYKVEWKQSAYNTLLIPLGLLTLFLMGAAPLLSWGTGLNFKTLWKRKFRIPILSGCIGALVFALSYQYIFTATDNLYTGIWGSALISEIIAIITISIAVFVISGIIQEYVHGIQARRLTRKEGHLRAFYNLLMLNKRRYTGYLVHLSIVFLIIGYSGSAFKKNTKVEFHYYLLPWQAKNDFVHYYSGDKAYIENYEIQARDFFLRPIRNKISNPKKPIHFTISHEAHYHVQSGKKTYYNLQNKRTKNISAIDSINQKTDWKITLLKALTGYILDGRMRTERHFYPQINPVSSTVLRNSKRETIYTPTSEPDIRSAWNEDLYIQLGAINTNKNKSSLIQNTSLNYLYESYYFLFDKDIKAYKQLFPPNIKVNLEIWINPLIKFIWLGSILFFLSGLLLILPFGRNV